MGVFVFCPFCLHVQRLLMEVLCSTTRTGPVLLTREEALLKLLPLLDRPEAKTFIAAARLAVRLKKTVWWSRVYGTYRVAA